MKKKGIKIEVIEFLRVQLSKLKADSWIEIELKSKRNPKFHRKYWAFCNKVAEYNQHEGLTPEQVSTALKYKSGHFDLVPQGNGIYEKKEKSISFANMEQQEFEVYYENAVNSAYLIWNYTIDELEMLRTF